MKQLLLVEDDLTLGITLKERLEKEGYAVLWSKTLTAATEDFQSKPIDLVILDVGLPDGSGFDFAQKIRKSSATPFIFVTAQASAPHRLQGFELGAEEYIPKPFHLKEVLLRVKRVLGNSSSQQISSYGDIKIDFYRMAIVNSEGISTILPNKDFQLLKFLISSYPRAVSRDEILNTVWGEENYPSNRTVDNVIVRLRQLLSDDGSKYIRSVRGFGYQWIAT
jgi:two-component system, OmpR family, phosphate regulon response regulator PhoB